MEVIGKSPVSVPALILAKLAFLGCSLFFIVKVMNLDTMLYDSAVAEVSGAILYAGGFLMVSVSLLQLGQSALVGIPERATALKTHGLYRFTRNPVYLGAFVMCAGSCLYAMHIVNFLLFAITVVIHLRIVSREEEFLEERFGQEWLDYKERVPRFIGPVKRANALHN